MSTKFLEMTSHLEPLPDHVESAINTILQQQTLNADNKLEPFYQYLVAMDPKIIGMAPGKLYLARFHLEPIVVAPCSLGSAIIFTDNDDSESLQFVLIRQTIPALLEEDLKFFRLTTDFSYLIRILKDYDQHGENIFQRNLKDYTENLLKKQELWQHRFSALGGQFSELAVNEQ